MTVKKSDIGSHGGEALQASSQLVYKRDIFRHGRLRMKWRTPGMQITGGNYRSYLRDIREVIRVCFYRGSKRHWERGMRVRRVRKIYPAAMADYADVIKRAIFMGTNPAAPIGISTAKRISPNQLPCISAGEEITISLEWAEGRIKRYLLENGASDKNFGVENWADYKKYFYPEGGDYATTKRWKFIDELVNDRIDIT